MTHTFDMWTNEQLEEVYRQWIDERVYLYQRIGLATNADEKHKFTVQLKDCEFRILDAHQVARRRGFDLK